VIDALIESEADEKYRRFLPEGAQGVGCVIEEM
jgi:hypothetical protein